MTYLRVIQKIISKSNKLRTLWLLMDTEELLLMLAFTLPISFLPGPNNLLSAAHSSQHGFRNTLPLILGMILGWILLGTIVGYGALFIEENQTLLTSLTYIGIGYIIYLSYKIATAHLLEEGDSNEEGAATGILLQVVNGKAFIHLLILMTTFGHVFGGGITGKIMIALVNGLVKLIGWLLWGAFGSGLKQIFSDPKSGILINRIMGLSLFGVAVWIGINLQK